MRSFTCSRSALRTLRASTATQLPQPFRVAVAPASPLQPRPLPQQCPRCSSVRSFQTSASLERDNKESEKGPTNISDFDVLGDVPAPSTSVDVCMFDGFGLNSGVTITGGNGALLVNGEAFAWRPWDVIKDKTLVNGKGQFDLPAEVFGMFGMLWPRPDILVIGVGKSNLPLSPQTRQHISKLGMRVEVLDTRNAASQFNLLATERGVSEVAAALIPMGWKDGVGVV